MIRIGIICPSEVALRRFLPAVSKANDFRYVGVAVANEEEWIGSEPGKLNDTLANEYKKAETFVELYGGSIFRGYKKMLESNDIDAIYLPLPPALHFQWGKLVLESGKHLFIEKPFTIFAKDTQELIKLAGRKKLAIHENYMFIFHNQLEYIKMLINNDRIGSVRLYRIAFGFPRRAIMDFRYNKALGGGSLLDCGGYTIKLASILIGGTARIAYSNLNYLNGFEVDVYGSAAMINDGGDTVQLSFGMDNKYKCDLEVWGSKGTLYTDRILTAPAGFESNLIIKIGDLEAKTEKLPADDSFFKSIEKFGECISSDLAREKNYSSVMKQAELVEEFRKKLEVNQ